jgi:hypothetical protein
MTRFTVLLIASMLVAGLHGAAPAWAGAMGSPAEAQAYAQRLSQRLDADARGVARQALETADIPQPCRAFWMKYFVSA